MYVGVCICVCWCVCMLLCAHEGECYFVKCVCVCVRVCVVFLPSSDITVNTAVLAVTFILTLWNSYVNPSLSVSMCLGENWPLLAVGKSVLADIAAGEKTGVSAMRDDEEYQDASGGEQRTSLDMLLCCTK